MSEPDRVHSQETMQPLTAQRSHPRLSPQRGGRSRSNPAHNKELEISQALAVWIWSMLTKTQVLCSTQTNRGCHLPQEEIVLKYRDVTGDHQKELVMLLEDGRSHTAITYAVSLNNLCIIINEGHYVAFLQKNVGCNVLSKERLPAPDGYVCIVCQASCDAKAGHFAEDLRHLVTVSAHCSLRSRLFPPCSWRFCNNVLFTPSGLCCVGSSCALGGAPEANQLCVVSSGFWCSRV